MDLAYNVARTYTVARTNHGVIPQPKMRVVPRLYDLSLQSFMPAFIKSGCAETDLDQKIFSDLLQLIPEDSDLNAIWKINDSNFWLTRCLKHYSLNSKNPKHDYFQNFVQLALQKIMPPVVFQPFQSFEQQIWRCSEVFPQVTSLKLLVQPNFQFFEQLAAFKLKSLQMIFNKKQDTKEIEEMLKTDAVIKSKTLGEIARTNDDSVFPFHHVYDPAKKQKIEDLKLQQQNYTTDMARQYYITPKDLVGLKSLFKSQITELKLIDCGLGDDLVGVLSVQLKDSFIKRLSLANNYITDITDLFKICVQQPLNASANFLTHLDLSRNNLQVPACVEMMKALRQEEFSLEQLILSGNNLNEGWLLLANSILMGAGKFANVNLNHFDLAECQIKFKTEEIPVLKKLVEETGIKYLNLSGNEFDGKANGLVEAGQKNGAKVDVKGIVEK
ncbi:Conserved_hypothetical protein [Hexamita inflata]|uniref:Uncharacterized protein n=1 Tax=Hexamita inflata TaxID=28002 RepID=A0AA86QQ02_9EUKA|nr:Conserved hypothetical protein [Hexamita inflata]